MSAACALHATRVVLMEMADSSDLETRLRRVLDEGFVDHAEAWCERSQISMGYLSSYFTRARAARAQGMKAPGITLSTLEKLAASAGVHLEWLARGEGPMLIDGQGAELAPFDLARTMFLAGASDRARAERWLASSAFRAPTAINARELLDALEAAYARWCRAEDLLEAGASEEQAALALGGVGARIDERPDDEGAPRKLAPVRPSSRRRRPP